MTVPTVVTLDIGGTTIKGALVGADGQELKRLDRDTGASSGESEVVARVRAVARELADAGTVGVGLSVPGIVDTAAGVARHAVNLGFRDTPLAALVAEEVGVPVVLEQDCRAAAVAESEIGLGRDARDLMVVVLGTGVAAGLIVDGRPLAGADGSAGELGHLPVYPDGEHCACGQRGCLEVYASASGIARRYAAAGGTRAGATAADVASSLDSDVVAARVWREATEALGLALATATLLLDPALIVLAGGLTGAGDTLLRPVRSELQGALAWRQAPPVANSPLGGDAGRLGAAILAWRAAGYEDVVLRDAV
ncbi:ROK family protein [Cryptosporangium arvum]|uniref:Transcriptional regulator/sugar kinase n=1 Tax=Cryptosporangium arvum DSM 44712 TaxID=927661 RepID=A0A010ZS81_9ACTN|nr:ROK family protein [Cryptosporangium arvum]EXG80077.1 transcriptional regulator/sugar kinase [Cryptosporangium arvum DSM 44712]